MRRIILSLSILLAGCSTGYVINAGDLDDGSIAKKSVLVSELVSSPTDVQKAGKVAILAHGFSASTYEMQALEDYLEGKGYLVSNVLLGGHGTSVTDFEKTTWKDWGKPVADEYKKLREMGFQDVSVVGASTGGTLFLEMLGSQQLTPAPRRVVLVAPLVLFKEKTIAFSGLLEWLGAKSSPNNLGQNAVGNWYRNRPVSTLKSLVDLTEVVKGQLRGGISLDASTKALVIQSDQDPTVDPESTKLILSGVKGDIRLQMIHSKLHVPIRLPNVDRDWTETEITQQQALLADIDRFIAQ
ncbi:Carboxylesterase [compost metagenome]